MYTLDGSAVLQRLQQLLSTDVGSLFFFARQHAMHTERDSVVANPSVCPSNPGICV